MRLAIRFKDLYSSIVKLEHVDSCVGLNVFSFDVHGTEQRLQSRDVSSVCVSGPLVNFFVVLVISQ